jgi:aspartate dehydrogenase
MLRDEVRIGLIGLGTIGKSLAQAVATNMAGNATLEAVLVRPVNLDPARVFLADLGLDPVLSSDPEEFFEAGTTLIVEAAGQEAVRLYGSEALMTGRDLLVCATGAFTDDSLFEGLTDLARQYGRRLIIPSGAIGGIDALASAALVGLDEVSIITRKPPIAWAGTAAEEMVDLAGITAEPVCLFEGPAREAVQKFPQNVNVAATLACAGVGLDRTTVRIYADPTINRNFHEIRFSGRSGSFKIEVCGNPSPDNPHTSALTGYSVIKTIRNLTSPVIIG